MAVERNSKNSAGYSYQGTTSEAYMKDIGVCNTENMVI